MPHPVGQMVSVGPSDGRIGVFVVALAASDLTGLASVWFVARVVKPTAVQPFDSKPYQAAYRAAKGRVTVY
jgi:hypothetical protein